MNYKFVLKGLAVVMITFGLAMASTADFVDHFSNGSVTSSDSIQNFWHVARFTPKEKNDGISEPVGGPLTLSYFGDMHTMGGPRLFSGRRSAFDFFAHPVILTLTAAPNATLTPVKDHDSAPDGAWIYLGLTPEAGPGLTNGPNRIFIQLSNQNILNFAIRDSANALTYSDSMWSLPIDAKVTQTMLYLDGTDVAHGNFYFNIGVQYLDSDGKIINFTAFVSPWNLRESHVGQAQMEQVKTAYHKGAAVQLELLNTAN
jgi:hypothetical protein